MAIIHTNATVSPTKLDLLTAWLPAQPWYLGAASAPELARVGGFRLDDPQGEVGIEFMVVTDRSGDQATTYQVPLTYRAAPLAGADDGLAGADDGLVGTTEHGALGRRWVYDGTRDPVLVAELVALIQGSAEPQAQSLSDTPDPTVLPQPVTSGPLTPIKSEVAADGPSGTDLQVQTAAPDGIPNGQLNLRIHRVLRSGGSAAGASGQPCLSATWRLPDETRLRGTFSSAQYLPAAGSR
jgi:hypothetical protein